MALSQDNQVQMKLTHLQFLQDVITRMANYSATIKNYTVTVSAALLAFYSSDYAKGDHVAYAIIPLLAFMILDARYLGLERGFRAQYDKTRILDPELIDFAITSSQTCCLIKSAAQAAR